MVSLEALPGNVMINQDAHTVTLPATMRYGDLARQLQEAGWALSNLPSLPHISVAGSVATTTHGSGSANPSLASAVTAVSMVTGTADLLKIDHTSPDFPGAVVHLGALGVVTEITLAIEPTFEVRQDVYEHLSWDLLTSSFEEVMSAGYSVSAITDFAGDDVESLDQVARGRRPLGDAGGAVRARATTEKLHVTRGNDRHPALPNWAREVPGATGCPTSCSSSLRAVAEIQSEYLMDRRSTPVPSSKRCAGLDPPSRLT